MDTQGRHNRRAPAVFREGFTILEMLVVVAILAILVAILFPLAKTSIEKAKSAQCTGNLRTLYAGCMVLDFRQRQPPAEFGYLVDRPDDQWNCPGQGAYMPLVLRQ